MSIAYLHGVFVISKDLDRMQRETWREREREAEWGTDEVVSARDFHVKMPTGPQKCPIRYF